MSDHSDEVAAAVQTLRSLNEQADGVRAELVRLRRELAEAQQDLSAKGSAKLVEANEHLVLAALDAQTMAETAVIDLDKLARSSQRDPLTDMPNRALMLDRLENAIALARRHGTRIGVLFLDLDDFKPINDTLGHAVGDAVLQLVARRLESVVRHSDTVSRHSGDEFLVLLAEVSQESGAGMVAAKILSALAAPVVWASMCFACLRALASPSIPTMARTRRPSSTELTRPCTGPSDVSMAVSSFTPRRSRAIVAWSRPRST